MEGGSSVEKGRGEQPSLLLRREKEEEKMSSEAPEEFRPHPIIHFRRELGQAYKPNRVPRRRPIWCLCVLPCGSAAPGKEQGLGDTSHRTRAN